jgi:hypothetical protein
MKIKFIPENEYVSLEAETPQDYESLKELMGKLKSGGFLIGSHTSKCGDKERVEGISLPVISTR